MKQEKLQQINSRTCRSKGEYGWLTILLHFLFWIKSYVLFLVCSSGCSICWSSWNYIFFHKRFCAKETETVKITKQKIEIQNSL